MSPLATEAAGNDLLRRALFLPEQASTLAPQIDFLHYLIIVTTLSVGLTIAAAFLFMVVKYRRRSESDTTPRFTTPLWLEATYFGLPVTLFLAWFVIGFCDYVAFAEPPRDALDVYVTAKQWMWKFAYPDGPASINELRVPAGKPVRLLITSRDVIHSFFVPEFRLKHDAVPGRYTQLWFEAPRPGEHPVLCAEYCGLEHSKMRARVIVMEANAFQDWITAEKAKLVADNGLRDAQPPPGAAQQASLREQGGAVAARKGCLKCHSVDGTAHIGPTWRDLYLRRERLEGGGEVIADEAYLTESMMDPAARVVAGFRPVMPSYRGLLTPGETAALIEYIRALRSRDVTPTPSEGPVYAPASGR
ncbi:MAG: cytochrome c oxidase subunit II [Myxococcaceae bacterium]|nr:cytochrome c oxidase subunit II [Myxococcaceae bacterium]